jgi:tRNA dimethylallyltransferase
VKPLVAILGPTATGKSALGIAIAQRFDGQIINCDSTAVYRGFDIGTDKPPMDARGGIPHHLIDIADPTDEYTAAQYGRDAAAVVRDLHARGKLPILVGGTGFYYRALTRGLFPGPGKDADLRARLERIAQKKGVEALHRLVARVDPDSALRIQPRDRKRLVRALEVYFQTGRPLTAHFDQTVSPLDKDVKVTPLALRMPAPWLADRLARRVDEQFEAGLLAEIRRLLASGVPPTARPFGGLVYRQAMDYLQGVRDEAATRALIAQENRRYARRQLIWFRKEPSLVWFEGPGTSPDVQDSVISWLIEQGPLRVSKTA